MTKKAYNVLFFVVGMVMAGQAISQDETYIRAGRLVDVVDGRARSNQTIVVRGDRIERVGASSAIDVPAGGNIIDLSDATVLPGLIDMHVHLAGDPDAHGYKNLAASVPRNALFGAVNARRTLDAGQIELGQPAKFPVPAAFEHGVGQKEGHVDPHGYPCPYCLQDLQEKEE